MTDADDKWVEHLENALSNADCDLGTVRGIAKCRPVPPHLRKRLWCTCLDIDNCLLPVNKDVPSSWKQLLEDFPLCTASRIRAYYVDPVDVHLISYFLLYHDPVLSSKLSSKRIDVESVFASWLKSLFADFCDPSVTALLWDIYFQRADSSFILFLSLVLFINSQESCDVMLPSLLQPNDLEDFVSLAEHYQTLTPKAFRSFAPSLVLPSALSDVLNETQNYFIVDCRPASDYNHHHLPNAFHLDASLLLRNPTEFSIAVDALLDSRAEAEKVGSAAAGDHICLVGGPGVDLHLVASHFLHRGIKYVSTLANEVQISAESFLEEPKSGASSLTHVRKTDTHSKRYRQIFSIEDDIDNSEISFDKFLSSMLGLFKCEHINDHGNDSCSLLVSSDGYMYLLKEVRKGYVLLILKRPLANLIQITSRRNFPEMLSFRFKFENGNVVTDQVLVEKAGDAVQCIKMEVLRLLNFPVDDQRISHENNSENDNVIKSA